jgi:PAS domain S-box-containing protein
MRSFTGRLRAWTAGESPAGDWLGFVAGAVALALCLVADVVLTDESAAVVGAYVTAPFVTALLAGPAATGAVGALALVAAAANPAWNTGVDEPELAVRLGLIVLGTAVAIGGAWVRTRSVGRSERLRLLDSVGAVADGSLPLSETLRRVTEVIVPALADICMVDAIHEGRVSRIATRVRGRDDAEAIERRMRARPPALPNWLVKFERSWRHIPQWWPRVRDEELRRMATSADDLRFLRSLDLSSSIVIPIRARDRNLGALTMISAWSNRRYSAEDVRFAQILASRIGLALDNAGLFSDLESVERRLDTVMAILDEAIVIHGPDGELVFANPAAARILGYETSEDAMATPPESIRERFAIRDEAGNEVPPEAFVGRVALQGEEADAQILRAVDRTTGRERWTRTKARPIEGPDGEVLYSVTAIEDVTDVKRSEFANALLARTGELLSHSAEYGTTLNRIPQLMVPDFADWCSIEIPGADGIVQRAAIAHRDPAMLEQIDRMRLRFPVHVNSDSPMGRVLRTGEAVLMEIGERNLGAIAGDADQLAELRDARLAALIIVPLLAAGRTVGALTFVNHDGSRIFDESDLTLAIEIARRAALAIENARIADARAQVADALQRELLPPSLPRMPGWELATMYEPAGELNEVGGDFYEVFEVRDGWAVVLGDVSGKGAAAAAVTAEARHTIRTAGAVAADPVEGLRVLDRNLRGRDDVALCSVVMLVLPKEGQRDARTLVYSAGHPHPLLVRDGSALPVGTPGPLLGVVDNPVWNPVELEIEPGDQLVLYTDGVIEARGEGGERFGTERLQRGLDGSRSADHVVERVRVALHRFGAARDDDAALVALRRTSGDEAIPVESGVTNVGAGAS